MNKIIKRLRAYYITAIFSVIFAFIGFSYNLWRLEVTEHNSTIRTASFEVLNKLSELELIIYSLHYDKDIMNGNPRSGWVNVGLIVDLSSLIDEEVELKANMLKTSWGQNWADIEESRAATDEVVKMIDDVRTEIRIIISDLK